MSTERYCPCTWTAGFALGGFSGYAQKASREVRFVPSSVNAGDRQLLSPVF